MGTAVSSLTAGVTAPCPPAPPAPPRASTSPPAPPLPGPPVSSPSGTLAWCTRSAPQWIRVSPGVAPASQQLENISLALRISVPPPVQSQGEPLVPPPPPPPPPPRPPRRRQPRPPAAWCQ